MKRLTRLSVLVLVVGCAARNSDAVAPESERDGAAVPLPSSFRWTSTGPLVGPAADATRNVFAVKDPSIVEVDGRMHLFATTASEQGGWNMLHLAFDEFAGAMSATPYYFHETPTLRGYHCAPQVFFFRPQQKWYLVYQSGQPRYSTTDDITKPETWSAPSDFFSGEPASVKQNKGAGGWLDFWVICDDALCHLFFTDDNGTFYRSQTSLEQFPRGFGEPVIAMRGTKESLYEASATYRIKGTSRYLTLIEAFGPNGNRYFRSFVADSLDGDWKPLADTWQNPFAGATNVEFPDGVWTNDVSHGELLRDGYDETLTVDPARLRFLYQGVDPASAGLEYFRLPWRLALLTPAP